MKKFSFSIRAIFAAIFIVALLLGLGRLLISHPVFIPPACLGLMIIGFVTIHLCVEGYASNFERVGIGCALTTVVYIFLAAFATFIWLYAAVSID